MDWLVAIYCLIASIIFLTIVFFVARTTNRYDIIDSAWGMAFIAIAIVAYLAQATYSLLSVQSLALLLVIIWGTRLSVHIYRRWSKTSTEDRRYADIRQNYLEKFGGVGGNMYIKVYLVQAVLAWIVSLPVILIVATSAIQFHWVVFAGVVVWLVGFYFETVGDAQLHAFTSNHRNKGKIMTSGLWRYTRHPNYFGEAMQWWGIWFMALSIPSGWLAIISPLTITILLLFISGVPLTERHFEGRTGWSEYKRKTSKFIPLPPRH